MASPTEQVKLFSNEWPTAEELEFFDKFAQIDDATDLIRHTSHTLKLPPCRVVFKNLDQLPKDQPLQHHIGRIFDIFIRSTLKKAEGDFVFTKYWLNLRHPAYIEKDGFWIMHQTYQKANGHTLMNIISKHSQSKSELTLDETLVLSMRVFKTDVFPGRGGRLSDNILKMFGLKSPNVVGNSHCLAKAIVIGRYWSDMNSRENDASEQSYNAKMYKKLVRPERADTNRPRFQLEEAMSFLSEMGMDPEEEEHNIEDLAEIAEMMPNYRFCVWSVQQGATAVPTVIFEANTKASGFIPLFHAEDHFEFFLPTCTKVQVRYCFKCCQIAKKDHWRNCKAKCKRCGRSDCEPSEESKFCEKCNIWFHSADCFNAHLVKANVSSLPFCEKFKKCKTCAIIHRRESYARNEHICHHQEFCTICKKKFNGLHNCVHAPVTEAARKRSLRKQEAWTIVAYDCETIVSAHGDYRGTESIGVKHVPNVLSFKIICNQCYGKFCVSCGEIQTFTYNLRDGESGTVLERFVHFLKTDSRTSNAYIIAHNGGRYDHVFVLEELIKNENYTPNFVMSGSTFISANVQISSKRTLHFLDSVKFLPMKLSQLPAAFDLATESKGHFPYMFNHPDNYGKVLSTLPPIEFYEPKYMGVKQRKEFEQWYEENCETEFNFDEEIVRYCKNDVQILSEALVKFIKICEDSFNKWNPIVQSTTIASYIMFVLKQEHIKTPTVGFIPENGYPGRNNSSFALKFLLWTEQQNPGMTLKHKLRAGGEHVIRCKRQIYSVDGYDPETGHVYEIHGCMYHGCPRCYLNREQPSPHDKNRTMAELYDYTMLKDDDIRDSGFTLHVHWECDIREELRKNAEMKHFFKNCNYTHQLRPREAMYGGRTQQFKSFVIADEEYTIEYYDYCSLYPFVNIRGAKYPIGTPLRLTDGDFDEIVPGQPLPYRGLAFCDILPPKSCPIPVLPVRVDSKLIFPLCRKCSTSKRKTPCKHTKVTDRYLTGVWCTDEINLAISEGYQLLKYHEVWDWPEESWFQGGFFEKFMSPLLKMKHESSGWPEEEMSEEKKQAHIQIIHDTDHVDLDPENVKKNPALRSLAKLFLNSTWGKFAQNPCKTETKLLPTSQGLKIAQFFDDQGYEPKCFKDWGENHVLVSRRPFKESLQTAPFTNIVYGALTTCGARIKLYEAMKRVGAENLIYCDTDSIIFRQKRGQDLLGDLIGEALGKMTREVPNGWTIAEIVAMAAKVYALKMVDENGQVKCVTKAKGITLNSETADAVNFETMKELMLKQLDSHFGEFIVQRMRMKRGGDILDGLRTVVDEKRLRPVMDKGLFSAAGEIIPFGTIEDDDVSFENDYPFENHYAFY